MILDSKRRTVSQYQKGKDSSCELPIKSASRESSSAVAPTLLLLEEVEEVYCDNSSSIEESLESLILYTSCIVINTRIVVKVDDSEIVASRGAESSALAPEDYPEDPEDLESEPITAITLEPYKRKKISSSTSLNLADSYKLKGGENYTE
ncbi:uncharacterized protein RAG0_07313 [Rhynchosporium agropyri]|uniref:Uncharacterized protein n=1 Tax=Rhynchosporium agropyri TaxID=914238 RepID=A0A1E1KKY0_9HELO|nr:uncharacterized protein RAG0_07313 [Rhynchosporium agropyri]